MKSLPCIAEVPFVDVDYCQFTDWTGPWGYQNTPELGVDPGFFALKSRVCHPPTCPNTFEHNGRWVHREKLGGRHMRFNQRRKFRIPEGVFRYLCNSPDPEVVREVATNLCKMGFQPTKRIRFEDENFGPNRSDLPPYFGVGEFKYAGIFRFCEKNLEFC